MFKLIRNILKITRNFSAENRTEKFEEESKELLLELKRGQKHRDLLEDEIADNILVLITIILKYELSFIRIIKRISFKANRTSERYGL